MHLAAVNRVPLKRPPRQPISPPFHPRPPLRPPVLSPTPAHLLTRPALPTPPSPFPGLAAFLPLRGPPRTAPPAPRGVFVGEGGGHGGRFSPPLFSKPLLLRRGWRFPPEGGAREAHTHRPPPPLLSGAGYPGRAGREGPGARRRPSCGACAIAGVPPPRTAPRSRRSALHGVLRGARSCPGRDSGTGFQLAETRRTVESETSRRIGCRSRVKCNSISDWLGSCTTWGQRLWWSATGRRRRGLFLFPNPVVLSYHCRTECPSRDLERSESQEGPGYCQVHTYCHSHFALN